MAKKLGSMSSLQAALEDINQLNEKPDPDEFTARDLHKASKDNGATQTLAAIRNYLFRGEESGRYTMRKLCIDGKWVRFYRVKNL